MLCLANSTGAVNKDIVNYGKMRNVAGGDMEEMGVEERIARNKLNDAKMIRLYTSWQHCHRKTFKVRDKVRHRLSKSQFAKFVRIIHPCKNKMKYYWKIYVYDRVAYR